MLKVALMDEKRQRAYLYLLQKLLRCSPGSEQVILNDNRDLLDSGLVQMMGQMAEALAEKGDRSSAACLINLAHQLTEALDLSAPNFTDSPIAKSDSQLDFLLQVLQATQDSQSNPQVVYSLLQENLDLLDDHFAQVLKNWAMNAFSTVTSEESQIIAGTIFDLSRLLRKFPYGQLASNIEIAIAGYTVITSICTVEAFSHGWASLQMSLGNAYGDRIKGEKADNLERAIQSYQHALSVFTRDTSPHDWALTQMNLGTAYRRRIKEEKVDNLERAIQSYQQALSVFTCDASPSEWAVTQRNLGTAYRRRIQGEKADNLERAIQSYQRALSAFARDTSPDDWALTQMNLGTAYRDRIWEDKADNLEQAIQSYQDALSVFVPKRSSYNWATTQMNLGTAYRQRIKGDRADNLEQAIQSYQQALSVFTRDAFPDDWASTQMNLGNAYSNRVREDKADNLERAIVAYQQALSVQTREAFPYDWAVTQMNLGTAYYNRLRDNKTHNLERAIEANRQALSMFTPETFPQENAEVLFNLGLTYEALDRLSLAHDTYKAAIATTELLRDNIHSGNAIKQKLAEEWHQLHLSTIGVCLKLNRPTEAIEYVERSKTRNLVELILNRDRHTIFPPDVACQLQQLQHEIAMGQDKIQNHNTDDLTSLTQQLKQLRQKRDALQDRYLPIGSSFTFDQFHAVLDEHTAIIEWYVADDKTLAFIISPNPAPAQDQPQVKVWQSTTDEHYTLFNWANAYLSAYYEQNDNWQAQLTTRLEELVQILHLDELVQQLPKECKRLLLIPHRFLHLFPLHALPLFRNGKKVSLLDRFPEGVSYAPSCQLLLQAQQRKRPNFTHLLAIQNPTNDLAYTDLEVQAIADYFNPVNVLKHKTATLTAISNTNLNAIHCAHFSCHGYFNLRNAGKSALILADTPLATAPANPDTERYLDVRAGETHDLNQCLTLDTILSLNLEQCRLVTLSACETGLIDGHNTSDEYIGLPSGFLVAGSPSVVSSLWKVSDISTAFLMFKFYENLSQYTKLGAGTIAVALNQAQNWLRNLTVEEFNRLWDKFNPQIEQIFAQLPKSKYRIFQASIKQARKRKPYPFVEPYYWAAFTATGL